MINNFFDIVDLLRESMQSLYKGMSINNSHHEKSNLGPYNYQVNYLTNSAGVTPYC